MFNWLRKLVNIGVEAEPTGVRARNAKGHFVKDDKSTPNVDESKKRVYKSRAKRKISNARKGK